MKLQKLWYGILCISSSIYALNNNKILENKPVEIKKNIDSQSTVKSPSSAIDASAIDEIIVTKKINIGIKDENRVEIVDSLRSLLADNYVLYTKALNFHWNVEGELFSQLHAFFKMLYESLQDTNDLLAERIRALGSYSPASLKEFLELTQLKENTGSYLPYRQMLQILLDDHETVIRSIRNATELSSHYNDWGTNNLLAGLLEKQEKNSWMIRAHLYGKR